jgi:hypothetical protein
LVHFQNTKQNKIPNNYLAPNIWSGRIQYLVFVFGIKKQKNIPLLLIRPAVKKSDATKMMMKRRYAPPMDCRRPFAFALQHQQGVKTLKQDKRA